MSWKEVGENSGVYVLEYEAKGFGRTNCVATRVAEGFVVLSPAAGISEDDLSALQKIAPVFALMEPHAGHTLGTYEWNQLLPHAPVFATAASLKRIAKVTGIHIRPLSQFKTASQDVEFLVPPGVKEMNILIRVQRGKRHVVYADETLIDLAAPPPFWLTKIFFYLNGVKTGFCINKNYLRFFAKDKKALARYILTLIENNPFVIFAHGPVKSSQEDLNLTKSLLEQICG